MSTRAMLRSLIAVLALNAASAGTCLEDVQVLAAEHGMSVDPPNAPEGDAGNGVTSQKLSRSQGLIEPPRIDDPAVIEPREGVRYGMPTLPDKPEDRRETTAGRQLDPQTQALLEAILISARSEALRGHEEDCFKQVQKAEALIGESK